MPISRSYAAQNSTNLTSKYSGALAGALNREEQRFANHRRTGEVLLRQFAVGRKNKLHSLSQVCSCLVERVTLRIRAKEFLNERDVAAFGGFLENGTEFQTHARSYFRGALLAPFAEADELSPVPPIGALGSFPPDASGTSSRVSTAEYPMLSGRKPPARALSPLAGSRLLIVEYLGLWWREQLNIGVLFLSE